MIQGIVKPNGVLVPREQIEQLFGSELAGDCIDHLLARGLVRAVDETGQLIDSENGPVIDSKDKPESDQDDQQQQSEQKQQPEPESEQEQTDSKNTNVVHDGSGVV
ncbi:MAG: hypothetical protein FVQ80_15235 [Planctomycetes bacterium]|nr:hypothetical protein [Planctomycetota bacterium]